MNPIHLGPMMCTEPIKFFKDARKLTAEELALTADFLHWLHDRESYTRASATVMCNLLREVIQYARTTYVIDVVDCAAAFGGKGHRTAAKKYQQYVNDKTWKHPNG